MTLRHKLLLWYSGVFLLSACGLVYSMYAVIAHKLTSDLFHNLEDEYQEVRRISAEHLDDPAALRAAIELEVRSKSYLPMSYRLYDVARDRDVLTVAPRWSHALHAAPDWKGGDGGPVRSTLRVGNGADRVVYLLAGPLDRAEHPNLALEVGVSYRRIYKRLKTLRDVLAASLLFSVLVAVAGGGFLASRSLKPIDRITNSLERIQAEDLSARLEGDEGNDEIARLRAAVNALLARLERAFGGLRAFTADAAHELRTPLAGLKCELEVENGESLSDDTRAELLRRVDELSHLVNDLLLLASLDAETYAEQECVVDVGPILTDVGEAFGLLAEERGLQFSLALGDGCPVRARPSLLRRLFGNLLDNAIAYTPAGGSVSVALSRQGDACRVVVADTGIGLGPQDVERVFERFYRADESRSREAGGLGLGLSLCKRIVELAGGTIAVESREGEGATFTVSLPRARS